MPLKNTEKRGAVAAVDPGVLQQKQGKNQHKWWLKQQKIGIRRGLTMKKWCFNIIGVMYNNNELSQLGDNVMNNWHIIIINNPYYYYLLLLPPYYNLIMSLILLTLDIP